MLSNLMAILLQSLAQLGVATERDLRSYATRITARVSFALWVGAEIAIAAATG